MTLVEVASATGILALATLGLASAMTGSLKLERQSRERTWARVAAQRELESLAALSGRDLERFGSREFAVGFDQNGDGSLSPGEQLRPAPPMGESPARTRAGKTTVDITYPGMARATVWVRWRTGSGEAAELRVQGDISLER